MRKEQNLKSKVAGSLVWKFLERGGVQVTQFIVSIVIARLLAPEAYGPVALLTVFVSIATVLVQSGLNTALIQKKDTDAVDYSSVFYYSLLLAAVLYIILFFSAGTIAGFYEMPELMSLLRVMALTLFPGALNSLQIALLSKQMQFKKQFYSNMIAAAVSGLLGIAAAVLGMGTWALVLQQLSYQSMICILLWFAVRWRPALQFSFSRTKSLLKYGIRLLGARLIDTVYHNLESLIIGKKYSAEMLAFYNKGKQFPMILIDNIDGSVQSVLLSAYSQKQDNIQEVKRMLRKTLSLSTYLVFPCMVGLAVTGKPLVQLVLGEPWMDCLPFLQLYCLIAMLFPLQTANLQAINAIGRSDVYLKLMTVKRAIGVAILFVSVFCFESVLSIVYACFITEVISITINFIPNLRLLGYRIREQMTDILPNLVLSILMGIPVYLLSHLSMHPFLLLLLECLCGAGCYLLLSAVTKNSSFFDLLQTLKKRKEQ